MWSKGETEGGGRGRREDGGRKEDEKPIKYEYMIYDAHAQRYPFVNSFSLGEGREEEKGRGREGKEGEREEGGEEGERGERGRMWRTLIISSARASLAADSCTLPYDRAIIRCVSYL